MSFWNDTKALFQPPPVPLRPRQRTGRIPNPNTGLLTAAWITFFIGCLLWPLLVVSFVLGAILAAKGNVGSGVVLMVLSVIAPVLIIGVIIA